MTLSIIQNPELIEAVEGNLRNSRYYEYVNRVLSQNLGSYSTYLWGGAVRDPIVRRIYGRSIPETRDFDILVDDSNGRIDFLKLLADLGDINYTRFGSPKLRPTNGLEIDIVPFSNTTRLLNGEKLPICVETVLTGCDFITSALAYDLQERTIHSCGALEGIESQEIELLYQWEPSYSLMCKLVLQSERLGFRIGNNALRMIAQWYGPELDGPIKEYLEYKRLQDRYSFVVERLREIQALG